MYQKLSFNYLFIIVIFFFSGCTSAEVKKKPIEKHYSLSDYQQKDLWQERSQFIKEKLKIPKTKDEDAIYLEALSDSQSIVVEQALANIIQYRLEQYKKKVIQLINHTSAKVRWQVLDAIAHFSHNEADVNVVAKLLKDIDWLVREKSYKMLRTYNNEKRSKKYYYTVLMALPEKNPSVLKQIYKTLEWYGDPNTFTYLLKRSYFAKTIVETLLIIRELNKFDDKRVDYRLKKLAKYHPKAIIRNEAKKLLEGR